MKLHNLHCHTTYSDGHLTPERLVERAKEQGLEIVGITDHAFTSKLPNFRQVSDNLAEYIERLRTLQYDAQGIQLLLGLEIDFSEYTGTHPQQLPIDLLNQLDYVLFEYVETHYDQETEVGYRDIRQLLDIRGQIQVPVGLAHNDLQMNFSRKEEYLAEALAAHDIFVELEQSESRFGGKGRNTRFSGGKDYYMYFEDKLLQLMKEKEIKVVIGTDAHRADQLVAIDDAISFVQDKGLIYHKLVE